jgi:hypothetical protein
LALIVASTAVAGAIHSGAQAAEQINCNSPLTRIALSSEQGSEGGISPRYAHCVSGAQAGSPVFTTRAATKRAGVAGRPAVSARRSTEQVSCNSPLTQIALMSQQGDEGGIWPIYAHCVPGELL